MNRQEQIDRSLSTKVIDFLFAFIWKTIVWVVFFTFVTIFFGTPGFVFSVIIFLLWLIFKK